MMSREELRRYRRGWLKVPGSSSSGSIGRPTLATPEKGAAIYAHIREKVRAKVFLTPEPDERLGPRASPGRYIVCTLTPYRRCLPLRDETLRTRSRTSG